MKQADENHLSIRRIMVALDASPRNVEMIEIAAKLAARIGSELIGLFVEDINLLRMADLPFASEIGLFSNGTRRLDSGRLELEFRAQANWMRRTLANIAEHENLAWDFRVARGSIVAEILTAGAEADLLILGKVGRSLIQRGRIGSTVRMLLHQRAGLTMILHEMRGFTSAPAPVVAIYDGSLESRKALDAAGRLVETEEIPLRVIVLADDEGSALKLESDVAEKVRSEGLAAKLRRLINPSLEKLAMVAQMESTGPVVIPCSGKHILEGEALCTLVNAIANPVLVVR
jgi:nucleotide-binding universal stress UspA family protein